MNISPNNYNTNISFKGQRLFPIKLIRTLPNQTREIVDGFFTRMDKSDISLAKEIFPIWSQETRFGRDILHKFIRQNTEKALNTDCQKVFMIEIPSEKNAIDRVKGFATVSKFADSIYVDFLQSANQAKSLEKLKSIGSMLLYGIAKIAQKENKGPIILQPTPHSRNWYPKFLFERINETEIWVLSRSNIDKLIANLRKKFNL
ncbi:hypothetical protein IJE86_01580 [bacterium]|nr:hypothetical protein [bacterium]